MRHTRSALVHLASGIGNIVLATPLLMALREMDFTLDVLLDADYSETGTLFQGWSVIRAIHNGSACHHHVLRSPYDVRVPAVPPFYWRRFAGLYRALNGVARRPADALFYSDEQRYYLEFARNLGYSAVVPPHYCVPAAPAESAGVGRQTLVIAPGCKTGEMASKRWPFFPELSERFQDVVVVGTSDDLRHYDGSPMKFPGHVRILAGRLSLAATAEVLAAAGIVAGNDSGLSHVAGATGTPTVMIFGPTPHLTLGQLPPNVVVIRSGLPCEPCWLNDRFHACAAKIDCLRSLAVPRVERAIRDLRTLGK